MYCNTYIRFAFTSGHDSHAGGCSGSCFVRCVPASLSSPSSCVLPQVYCSQFSRFFQLLSVLSSSVHGFTGFSSQPIIVLFRVTPFFFKFRRHVRTREMKDGLFIAAFLSSKHLPSSERKEEFFIAAFFPSKCRLSNEN